MTSEGDWLQNRYRLQAKLGSGGMGSVWLARDEVLGRQVALKELNASAQADRRDRAVREARALAAFSHPAIVGIYDIFFARDDPWIVMEYIPGSSLAELVDERVRPLTEAELARIADPVLAGLRAAHAVGVVHRDVKPSNILVTRDGAVFLVDFGIAKIAGDLTMTAPSRVMGTPEFLAPEQVHGQYVSGATDLWSLGVTMFWALEGYSPFRRGDPAATMFAVVGEELPRMRTRGRLAEIVPRLLRKEPEKRISAARLAHVLAAILGGPAEAATSSRPRPDPGPPPDPPRPRPGPGPAPGPDEVPETGPRPKQAPRPEQSLRPEMAPRPEQGPPPVHPAGNGNRADPGTGRRRALLTMTERDLSTVRQQVSQAGTAAGAVVLCDMAEQNAAQVLAGYPAETAGALIEAIAARRLATAGAILRMLSAAKAGAAVGYLAPVTAAAILGAMPVRQAVRILSCTNARRAGGVIESLQPGIAIQVIAALPESQAARVLGFVGPPRVAVLIRALGGPGNALLARLDADYRAQVLRYLSR